MPSAQFKLMMSIFFVLIKTQISLKTMSNKPISWTWILKMWPNILTFSPRHFVGHSIGPNNSNWNRIQIYWRFRQDILLGIVMGLILRWVPLTTVRTGTVRVRAREDNVNILIHDQRSSFFHCARKTRSSSRLRSRRGPLILRRTAQERMIWCVLLRWVDRLASRINCLI